MTMFRTRRYTKIRRAGVTLVELMVVIAIIAMLISLLMPAVQAARDSSRIVSCKNNLRQLGLALQTFHDSRKVFPASGWTTVGPSNPAGSYVGWRALVLPYLEQSTFVSDYQFSEHWWQGKNPSIGQFSIPVFVCPSTPQQPSILNVIAKPPRPAIQFPLPLAPSDYEALMGVQKSVDPVLYGDPQTNRSVMFRNSQTRMADVRDGTSHTVIVVECAARPLVYRQRTRDVTATNSQGNGWVDSESGFSLDGSSVDGTLQGLGPALTSRAINATNENEPYSFHQSGSMVLYTDGHVRFASEETPLAIAAAFATRSGGEVSDLVE